MKSPEQAAVDAFRGALIADAIAMPVHWYYNQQALARDYPEFTAAVPAGYLAPKSPHADSILWRSSYVPANEKGDILREQSQYWGQRGIHYHQFLAAGENTLNYQLAIELATLVRGDRDYDPERWLQRYVAFMLTPGKHRDTYVEEYHRHFFTNYAAGRKPISCGVRDVHIGGLVPVPALVAALGPKHPELRRIVRVHVGLTHKDDEVLEAADTLARMLVRLCAGDDLRTTILEEAPDWISAAKVREWEQHPDHVVVGGKLSSACYIPDAFPAALFLAWRHAGDFAAGVCANARVGGDNCHRGAVVGSLLGASAPIPDRYMAGLQAGDRVEGLFPQRSEEESA
ncbi:MAG: ADP-ribosylglycohydrolase family protein [Planctomycetota bacterium]